MREQVRERRQERDGGLGLRVVEVVVEKISGRLLSPGLFVLILLTGLRVGRGRLCLHPLLLKITNFIAAV